MGISIEELRKLEKDSYQILDIRNETEISHGAIPGAIAVAEDAIDGHPEIDFTKKLVTAAAEESIVWKWQRHWKKKVLMQSV